MLLGRSAEALAAGERVLPLAERFELGADILEVLTTRGAVLASIHRLGEAITLLLGAVSRGRALQLPQLELRARVNLSYATAAEDPQLSYKVAREGLELARRLGLRSQGAYLLSNASETAMRIGEWDWVAEQTDEDVAADDEGLAFGPLIQRARLQALRGAGAEALIAQAQALLEGQTEVQGFSMVDDVRSDMAMALGHFEESRRLATSSYERMDAPDSMARARAGRLSIWMRDAEAVARILEDWRNVPGAMARIAELELRAGLAAVEGRSREAINLFREALARWRESGLRFDLALTGLSMVHALGTDHPEVREAAAEAREILTQLGAAPLLAQLDAAEAAAPPSAKTSPSAGEVAARVSSAR
jgi:tetratricopeptide (TPR) repeat protein